MVLMSACNAVAAALCTSGLVGVALLLRHRFTLTRHIVEQDDLARSLDEAGITLAEATKLYHAGRPVLLARLKTLGVQLLPKRQAIANAIGKRVKSSGVTSEE